MLSFFNKQFKELVYGNNWVLIAEKMEKNVSAVITIIILVHTFLASGDFC